MFTPTRAAALEALDRFIPSAGITYARRRNFDLRPDGSGGVSQLSPYIRHRLISEEEVLQATLSQHSPRDAEKFIQEVFWRSYWKGWLEMRPQAWMQYKQAVQAGLNRLQSEAGLRQAFDSACRGETDIECFNFWSQNLVKNGYIHNHARMWFASIWIFTLRLPWALGADFFLRHLLDGDPASNTLGWKWVAGLQTEGKTYLARASNIAEFTENRFQPEDADLAPYAEPPEPFQRFDRQPILFPDTPRLAENAVLLLHEDDLWGGAQLDGLNGLPVAAMICAQYRSPLTVAERVKSFTADAARNTADVLFGTDAPIFDTVEDVATWAKQSGAHNVVTAYAPTGPVSEALSQLEPMLKSNDIRLTRVARDYDKMCWPHATKGFFPFKKNIPEFINKIR
ncbi:MAG: DNA photolyase [Litoreibacter sp.]|nr:DNA photolyase [Litoreibacter sp.]